MKIFRTDNTNKTLPPFRNLRSITPRCTREKATHAFSTRRTALLACTVSGILSALFLASAAQADTRCHPSTDICFPTKVVAEAGSLPLVGLGLFRYWGFQVYHVALYAPQGVGTPQTILNAVPKRLVIHYFREFTIKDFQKSGRTVIAENPSIRADLVESGLRQIDALYRPIKPGDRYEVTFLPGVGTQLALNGQLLGTITGSPEEIDEFQRAYFGIWLAAQHSIDDDLREEILSIS